MVRCLGITEYLIIFGGFFYSIQVYIQFNC